MTLSQVISGGQTGVDRAALHAAIQHGVAIGGWLPPARATADGPLDESYPLREIVQAQVDAIPPHLAQEYYPAPATDEERAEQRARLARTRANVLMADGTLVLTCGGCDGGTNATCDFAARLAPHAWRRLSAPATPEEIGQAAAWIRDNQISVLNIAGSPSADAYQPALALLGDLFTRLHHPTLIQRRGFQLRANLRKGGRADVRIEGLLPHTLNQMYAARAEFMSTARHAVYLVVIAIAGGGAALTAIGASAEPDLRHPYLLNAVAAVLFLIAAFAPVILRSKLRAGYDLYVGAALHAACVFEAVRAPPTHPWIKLAYQYAAEDRFGYKLDRAGLYLRPVGDAPPAERHAPRNDLEFSAVWRGLGLNLFQGYMRILWIFAAIALAGFFAAIALGSPLAALLALGLGALGGAVWVGLNE